MGELVGFPPGRRTISSEDWQRYVMLRKTLDDSWKRLERERTALEDLEKIAAGLKAEIIEALLDGAEIENGGRIAG